MQSTPIALLSLKLLKIVTGKGGGELPIQIVSTFLLPVET